MSSTVVDERRDRAFERLYERYAHDVQRYALTVMRNPTEAEDVTQTTFLNAYRAMQAGEEPVRPQNWLIAIAHNACRSRIRLTMRRPREVPLDDVASQLSVPESERPNVRELLRALGRLPFNQRTAITMRELEGRSYPEIAETLGVSVGAVEALIARARRTLRLQAAALRGATVMLLPRSLRRLLENGDAAGGALGAGVVAKVGAVLVAGAVAGGIGHAFVDAAPTPAAPSAPSAPSTPSMQSRAHDPAPQARALRARAAAAARSVGPTAGLARPAPELLTGTPSGGDAAPTAPSGQAGPTAPPAEPQRHVVATVQKTGNGAVPTLPVALPEPPAVPAVAPGVEVPTVPRSPDLPPLPLP